MSFHNVCKKVLWCLSHIKTRCNLCCYTCEMAVIYFLPHNLSARNKLDVFPNELFHFNIQELNGKDSDYFFSATDIILFIGIFFPWMTSTDKKIIHHFFPRMTLLSMDKMILSFDKMALCMNKIL